MRITLAIGEGVVLPMAGDPFLGTMAVVSQSQTRIGVAASA
jgi:hypothetical protein